MTTENTDDLLLALVMEETITDQETMRARLRERGVSLTQPTLSRRLARLSIRKVHGRYAHYEPLRNTNPLYFEVELSPPNLLVIRTAPGFAQALGLKIDQLKLEGVAGSLAGDDTVFVAVGRPQILEETRARLESFLGKPA
jgi:transcriptional regulator of arginine metabolism